MVYTDIGLFYHRGMEKEKLFILDVCGAYSQKDTERLDHSGPARSEINKPTRDNGGQLADRTKTFIGLYGYRPILS